MAARGTTAPQGRRREISGILLLGLAIFCTLSLFSMHAGAHKMMGPGGAAAAAGLYSLAGLAAYGLVAAMLVVAFRCFRAGALMNGLAEGLSSAGLVVSSSMLLHLLLATDQSALRGPGGLLGQWLGELGTGLIGVVGAGLLATTILAISMLVLTEVTVAEVVAVCSWLGRHAGRGLLAGGKALAALVANMFPERRADADDRAAARAAMDGAGADGDLELADDVREPGTMDDAGGDDDERWRAADDERATDARDAGPGPIVNAQVASSLDAGADGPDGRDVSDSTGDDTAIDAGNALALAEDEEPLWRPLDEERAAIAAMVAEVAAADAEAESLLAVEARVEAEAAREEPRISQPAHAAKAAPIIVAPSAPVEPVTGVAAQAATPPPLPARRGATVAVTPVIVPPAPRANVDAEARSAQDRGAGFIPLHDGAFELPSTELLQYKPPGEPQDEKTLVAMADRLTRALADFGVRGTVKEIHMGPVVTMYEFAPAPGTRVGRIMQLENELAMALEAQAVRVAGPIPGKAAIGIEVPNQRRDTVYLKELLLHADFQKAQSKLQFALGKDIKGQPISVSLARMPHLLVAGTTGSGKSVTVNGIITSILYNASPDDVRFIMVDPKMLELSVYQDIPHLLLPVVTDPKKANLALRWAVDEMERRYELLAQTGVRDIVGYNAKVEEEQKRKAGAVSAAAAAEDDGKSRRLKVMVTGDDGVEREIEMDAESEGEGDAALEAAPDTVVPSAEAAAARPALRKLPYIVIVIDEFADLMMVAAKDVETSVARIAQKARAAGLHLIVATQRPSVDIITGVIKSNFPSRIALQVAQANDSRVILGQPGAEALLGNGDMLFSDRGLKVKRVHGAFLSDEEVHAVVDHLKKQGKPVYDMDILKPRDEDGGEAGTPANDFHDELYDQAVAFVCETRTASVSGIQRRLQIGYNRSARMVEQMERDGIVGPANGIKPREVLAPPGEYLQAAP